MNSETIYTMVDLTKKFFQFQNSEYQVNVYRAFPYMDLTAPSKKVDLTAMDLTNDDEAEKDHERVSTIAISNDLMQMAKETEEDEEAYSKHIEETILKLQEDLPWNFNPLYFPENSMYFNPTN